MNSCRRPGAPLPDAEAELHLLRRAPAAVLDQLQDIEISAHEAPWSRRAIASCFAPWYTVMAIGPQERLHGFAVFSVTTGEGELLNIGVHRSWQGRGLGRRLLDGVLAQMRLQGAGECFLDVAEGNEPALGLYGSTGFVICGRRRGYYPATEHHGARDAWCMHLEL